MHYVPNWDCYELPIELEVLQSIDQEARKELTPLKLRKKAAQFAKKIVDAKSKSFRRYKIWGALASEYEVAQIEVFGKMFF